MKAFFLSILSFLSGIVLFAQSSPGNDSFDGYVITDEGAWCWFADPRAIHHKSNDGQIDKTYIGYIDIHGAIKAMQIDWKTNTKEEILVRSCFQPDDHDCPTFLVLPDDRVMVFYSRHTDEPCFYYRVTEQKGDLTTLGEERKLLTKHNTTYPSPFILSDDPEHIYLCWRGINWHPTIGCLRMPDEDGVTAFEYDPLQIVQSTGARPYAKYVSNGKDKIYVTYTTGHPDNEYPNFTYCNLIDINTFELKDIEGHTLAQIKDGPHHVTSKADYFKSNPVAVVDHSNYRDWVWEMSLDAYERPVIAMVKISEDKKSHDYYHVAWTGKKWKQTFLAHAGGHFHQSPDIEHCYSGGMTIDRSDSQCIYGSVPVNGVYEIIKFQVRKNGSVSKTPVTFNSAKNNVRPYFLPGSSKDLSLVWMNGDYYDWIVSNRNPEGYCTSPRSIVPLPDNVNHSQNTLMDLSVSLSELKDKSSNRSLIWDFDGFSYGINRVTMKPYLIINDRICHSQNVIGTSDVWKDYHRTTNGKWLDPMIPDEISLRIVCSEGIVKTYINGLLDQSAEIKK